MAEGLYEFMILDVSLPDGDGRALCREFRDSGVTAPIILLTAADSDADTIEGLNSGANDYIAKPFRFAVLMARVQAHLRSHGQSEEAVYRIGPYTFRPSAKVLLDAADRKIRLTGEGNQYPQIPLPLGRDGAARDAAARGLGLQPRRDHAHAGNPYLPAAPEDRDQSGQARILVTESGGYRLMP